MQGFGLIPSRSPTNSKNCPKSTISHKIQHFLQKISRIQRCNFYAICKSVV
ncbi:hypothetical protein HanXRQr2_Chr16g0738691 [Helianthus annuus]|uniref:Uncharacterized protein n=1 Tax=Helianthus annuus TaxID=4232 RepID=A0A9K3GX51_HELAN|nr:hypothetical protein HanXRQr2_Chr16g0738691 [Helianthus annuus]